VAAGRDDVEIPRTVLTVMMIGELVPIATSLPLRLP
jgi:hypothetical protein